MLVMMAGAGCKTTIQVRVRTHCSLTRARTHLGQEQPRRRSHHPLNDAPQLLEVLVLMRLWVPREHGNTDPTPHRMPQQVQWHLFLAILLIQPLALLNHNSLHIHKLLRPIRQRIVGLPPSLCILCRITKPALVECDDFDVAGREDGEGTLVAGNVFYEAVDEDDGEGRGSGGGVGVVALEVEVEAVGGFDCARG